MIRTHPRASALLTHVVMAASVLCLGGVAEDAMTQPFEKIVIPSPTSLVTPSDPRSLALGGAFTAVANGAAATWWNPGALGIMPGLHLTPISYRNYDLRIGTDVNIWSYTGAAAAGIEHLGVGVFYHRIDYGPLSPIFRDGEIVEVSEVAYHVAAGFEPLSVLRVDSGRWQWGLGAALKHARFNSPTKATGSAVDVGSLLRVTQPVAVRGVPEDGFVSGSLGVMLRNINAGDFATDDAASEIARSVRLGLAFDSGFRRLERFGYLFGLLVAVDGRFYVGELAERNPTVHVGIEGRFVDLVSYRVGFERDTEFKDTDVHYGVALGVRDLRWNQRTVGVLLEFAAVDTAERSEHYAASMYVGF